ncbi:dynamin family protein [Domibacillus sp. DTU_2020_1001157_1_SI_ALB_TIR_016]|uniref:dynamin family protein n=1 Tax=Domibacillus sp. DTU_2020_1001157_1_SI_ALB_TIR_016 TaxID=3077789 RepID=UPI0028EF283F|nr:dynamin family protein [Domibacillus sp. DTU_2020_1001157_1_SI_ALB_TIR_016]WNS82140.1 dynamin family protein [Domibacillus sp. DTU_2020_1001157_1_SI_ALB_TIR_016]
MGTQTAERTLEGIRIRTAGLYEQFLHNGDTERADKAALFLRKLHEKELIVAFCGHFSAGKSTMINELTGEALLPSSPIPTSANVVKIKPSEENFAKIHYHHGRPLLFKAPYDMKHVKKFAKDGDEVASIEIGHAGSSLPPDVTVMDTPGVDSTDDAHRISTESALHLADMVFYVMDYNHVQSELNFIYTKELLSHGVKLFLIINQIDKHKEEELSFDAFRQSVKDSFATWNVEPEAFYFTSLRNRSLPYNDFEKVQALIQDSIRNREQLAEQSAETMMNRLVHEHMEWLAEQQKQTAEPLEAVVAEAGSQSIEEREAAIRSEMEKRDASLWLKQYEANRDDVLKNAILMPAATREKARSYLESTRPDFKVGLLFAKKKTEEEREQRLRLFVEDIQKQTEAQLEWAIRQVSAAWVKESRLDDPALALKAEELSVPVDASLAVDAVKPGAGVTGDAVLNYAEDVASLVKKRARAVSEAWKEEAAPVLTEQFNSEYGQYEKEHKVWAKRLQAKETLEELQKQREEREALLRRIVSEEDPILPRIVQTLQEKWQAEDAEAVLYDGVEQWQTEERSSVEFIKASEGPQLQAAGDKEAVVNRLRQMAKRLHHIPGFARFVDGALQKAARLENQTYTIALFGAFSAGKSSFANALLGEKVLPVSPNPTTAAVNRIHPVDSEHHHRTADVHLKPEEMMLQDVNASLGLFGRSAASLEEAVQMVPDVLAANEGEGKEKIHLSFLRAFSAGFDDYKGQPDGTLRVDLDLFRQFVAEEQKSCFVNSIDLYYDCDFTRLGITLVDTPGADSINARHTGVAFEYIKNADAILFVTYYNHAFSKADREFLIQLGRVKDAFELDKMFFVINAIDLAADEEELNDVKAYVQDQLLQYGIRFPRLHGVSSMLAVEEAMRGEWDHPQSGMKPFKESFRAFLTGDLAQMAVQSAEAEAERGVSQLQKLIAAAKESVHQGEQKREELTTKQAQMIAAIDAETTEVEEKRLAQELDELVHYVKQRVFYRFSDLFKESFNPATLSGQNETKRALQRALAELLQSVGYDLAQEMRATSIRVENHGAKLMQDKQVRLTNKASMIEPELLLSNVQTGKLIVPDFKTAFEDQPLEPFSGTLSLFKNAKAFFEKNEKQTMMQKLQEQIEQLADGYLSEQKSRLLMSANQFIDQETEELKQAMLLDVTEQFDAWLLLFEQTGNIEEWEQVLRDIS